MPKAPRLSSRHSLRDRSTKIGLALSEEDEGADLDEAMENAEQAWQEDSGGRDMLSRKRWLDTVFELADVREQPQP